MNYSRFINETSSRRKESPLRRLPSMWAAAPPGTVFIAGGAPNFNTFPFEKFDVRLKTGTIISLEKEKLHAALQYQDSRGYLPLIKKLQEFQTSIHNLEENFWDSRELQVTSGAQDGISRTLEMCLRSDEPVLCQVPCFPGALGAMKPLVSRVISVAEDEFGINPDALKDILQSIGEPEQIAKQDVGVPKILYVNPTASNPSGRNTPEHRRRDIYKLACQYNLLILEDDPYYFLQFHESRPVSFLSLDTECRVIRFDSFSKIVSSGMRLGFITGPKPLLERINLHVQVSIMHTSGLTQVVLYELLTHWDKERLERHLKYIQEFYRTQKDCMIVAANKHLTGLAEWRMPDGGMFLWLRIPGMTDTRQLAEEQAPKRGVIAMAGACFYPDDKVPSSYIRASYSTASPEEMHIAFARLAQLIKENRNE